MFMIRARSQLSLTNTRHYKTENDPLKNNTRNEKQTMQDINTLCHRVLDISNCVAEYGGPNRVVEIVDEGLSEFCFEHILLLLLLLLLLILFLLLLFLKVCLCKWKGHVNNGCTSKIKRNCSLQYKIVCWAIFYIQFSSIFCKMRVIVS